MRLNLASWDASHVTTSLFVVSVKTEQIGSWIMAVVWPWMVISLPTTVSMLHPARLYA